MTGSIRTDNQMSVDLSRLPTGSCTRLPRWLQRKGTTWGIKDDLRGQDQGHRVVEHALSEQQSVQIHVHVQLVEDGQDRHCGTIRNAAQVSLGKLAAILKE